uniref:Arabinofuranosidase n=1 Tax=Globodera pallida TaxID=36090 RepID=A0A183BX93_GLOPA
MKQSFAILLALTTVVAHVMARAVMFGNNMDNASPIFAVSSLKMAQEHPYGENDFFHYYAPKNNNDENLWSSALSRQLHFHLNRG